MNGRCHQGDWPAAGTPWVAWVIQTNGRATAAQSDAAARVLRQGDRKTMRSIATATRGSAAALGLHSIAPITRSADAANSLRDRAWSLAWRERTKVLSASSAKPPLVRPRSSEIQPTLSI